MIHLLTSEEHSIAFQGFYNQSRPNNGKLTLISSAYINENSPFDERIKNLFRKEKDPEIFMNELKNAGFKNIEKEIVTFDDWIYIVKKRLWTTFSFCLNK